MLKKSESEFKSEILELKPYQKDIFDYMCTHKKAGIFLYMGLGKTIISLKIIEKHIKEGGKKVLIIAPKAIAKYVWEQEIKKWGLNLTLTNLISKTPNQLTKIIKTTNTDIYLLNSESLFSFLTREENKEYINYDMIVIDESTKFKNPHSLSFSVLSNYILKNNERIIRTYLLTGTSTPNGIKDIWSQIYLLDLGKRLGKSYEVDFLKKYYKYDPNLKITKQNWRLFYRPKPKISENFIINDVKNKIKDICLYLGNKDNICLPDIKIINIKIEIEDKTVSHIEIIRDEIIQSMIENMYSQIEKNNLNYAYKQYDSVEEYIENSNYKKALKYTEKLILNHCLQLSSGFIYDAKNKDEIYLIHKDKLMGLRKFILENHQKENIIIVYKYRADAFLIKKCLKDIKKNIVLFKTDKKKCENRDIIKEWNDNKIDILLINSISGSKGLNLQKGGHILIWYSPTFDLGAYEQMNCRIYRRGQSENCYIYRIMMENKNDTKSKQTLIEELCFRLLKSKNTTQNIFNSSLAYIIKNKKNEFNNKINNKIN